MIPHPSPVRAVVIALGLVVPAVPALALTPAEAQAARLNLARPTVPEKPSTLDPTAPWQVRFDTMDADHDGRLTPDEVAAHAEKVFKAMDADGDGRVSAEEFRRANTPKRPGPIAERAGNEAANAFTAADTDHDGFLSLAEWKAASAARFAKADVAKRGVIYRWEYRRFPW